MYELQEINTTKITQATPPFAQLEWLVTVTTILERAHIVKGPAWAFPGPNGPQELTGPWAPRYALPAFANESHLMPL